MNFIDNPTETIEIAPANTITFNILGLGDFSNRNFFNC